MSTPTLSKVSGVLVKRGIGGVHHSVSAKYLQTYLDEYAFRYDRRGMYGMVFKEILGEVSKQAV
jgi:transposase